MTPVEQVITRLKEKFGAVKRTANEWVRIPCPSCSAHNRKKFKRYVNTRTLGSKCFICGENITREELLGEDLIILPDKEEVVVEEKKENPNAKVIPCSRPIPVNKLPSEHPAIQFLHKDHLHDLDLYAEKYGIIYCPSDAGKIFCRRPFISSADRLIFPAVFKGSLIGWQMRSIPGTVYGDMPDVVKYYHLFNKGDYLYNYDQAKNYEMVVLVEGVKKALKLPNAVASWGKNLTSMQVQLLLEWKRISLLLDAEPETQTFAQSLEAGLRANGREALNINLGKYGFPSPDEATSEQLLSILFSEWTNYANLMKKK